MNAKKYAWVLGKTWYYRKSFTVPAAVKNQYVFLCFDGIDYYAKIWLNGHELGRHEGMQGGPMLEVGSLLKPMAPMNSSWKFARRITAWATNSSPAKAHSPPRRRGTRWWCRGA